jgi:hypothetical protein
LDSLGSGPQHKTLLTNLKVKVMRKIMSILAVAMAFVACQDKVEGVGGDAEQSRLVEPTVTEQLVSDLQSGVFVASDGLVGCGLYYSTDGINWIQTNVTSGTLAGAQYSKGIWVAGAYGPGLIYSVGWEPS